MAVSVTLMMPPMRLSSSSTSEGETFSRVVATRSTPPSCHDTSPISGHASRRWHHRSPTQASSLAVMPAVGP